MIAGISIDASVNDCVILHAAGVQSAANFFVIAIRSQVRNGKARILFSHMWEERPISSISSFDIIVVSRITRSLLSHKDTEYKFTLSQKRGISMTPSEDHFW